MKRALRRASSDTVRVRFHYGWDPATCPRDSPKLRHCFYFPLIFVCGYRLGLLGL
jgi:hypothetical protein